MVSSRERQGLGPPQRHDYRQCRAGGREGSALQLYGSHTHARPQNWGCHWHFVQQRSPALLEEVAEEPGYTASPQCMSRHTALAQRKKWLKILAIQHREEVDEDPGYTASPQCMARYAALAPGMRLCVAVNTAFAESMEMVACMGTIKLESDSVRKYPEG